jgi:hypothetical protein
MGTGDSLRAGAREIYFVHSVQTGSGAHPASCLMGTEAFSGQGQEIFLLSTVSRLTPGPTQPPIQWVPGTLCEQGQEILFSPQCPDWLRGPPSLLSNGTGGSLRAGERDIIFSTVSRLSPGLTQPPIQWVPGTLCEQG